MTISMTYKTYVPPMRQVIVVSRQEDLPSPYNNPKEWEWEDAIVAEATNYDKIVIQIPDGPMQFAPNRLV
jgi:hypothetical protein